MALLILGVIALTLAIIIGVWQLVGFIVLALLVVYVWRAWTQA